jgi:membrane-bound lytic murein transglycosylase MltF
MTFAEWDRSPSGHWVMRQHTFLDWKVLKAQAIAASKLNPRAVSAAGAKGLFQFMDPTWQEWSERKQPGAPLDVWNPEHATFVAAAYLEWLLGRVGGDLRKAIAAYNWGDRPVMRAVQGAASSGRPRCRSRRRATSRGSWACDRRRLRLLAPQRGCVPILQHGITMAG